MRRPVEALFRAAGLFLVALPLLPLGLVVGDVVELDVVPAAVDWILGIALFGAVAWVVARALPERTVGALERAAASAVAAPRRIALGAFLLSLAILLAATSRLVFDFGPLNVDSVVHLFQAKVFAAGRLVAPPPPGEAFFRTLNVIVEESGWYGQYPPGHSALLALGVAIGAPWLVPVVLSLGTLVALYGFTRRAYDEATARLTALLLVLSSFFWLLGASFMNHVSALFAVALFLYAFVRWEAADDVRWMAAAAAALGLGFLSRPVTILAVGVPFGAVAIARAVRRRSPGALAVGALAFLVPASIYLLYNHATTGSAWLPGYVRLWGGSHGLGFHATPWGDLHTPLQGLRNEWLDIALLQAFLFEWPIPSLLPVGLAFLLGWTDRVWDRRLMVAFLAIPAAYLFYWHRDPFLGPRFLYAGVAFVVPLTARAIVAGTRALAGRRAPGGVPADRVGLALLGLCLAWAVVLGIPSRVGAYARWLDSMRADLVEEARAAGIDGGLVFVTTSWGERLLAEVYGLGVPASLAEEAYRRTDHCDLQGVVDRALSEGWDPARAAGEVRRLVAATGEVASTARLNGDPSLRLRAGRRALAPACADEIAHDRGGYTVYAPHVLANDPLLAGPWIVARDLRERNEDLRARYPGRPVWLYRDGRFTPLDGSP